ncbi:MAG: hypothetical protein GXO30_05510 [Epsilonproteobacteria bacterium]|nr:hypothetical protein [Campylobacterota bacterium]
MKKTILVAFALLGTMSLADNIGSAVDLKIAAIEKASNPQERVKLVNEFKVTLANMSANERASAISQLRSSTQGKKTSQNMQIKQQVQIHQMQDIQNAASQQMMQQQNAMSQAISEGVLQMGSGLVNNPINNIGNNINFPIQR